MGDAANIARRYNERALYKVRLFSVVSCLKKGNKDRVLDITDGVVLIIMFENKRNQMSALQGDNVLGDILRR